MKNVLVTGGCGFLGSTIVKVLLARGVESVRVQALPNESTDNIDGLDVEVVRGNVMNNDDCIAAVKGIDTVFHTAAIYKSFMPDPTMMYEVNNRGTFNMMEASRREA
ncbi:MAG: NAD-dependent epimerase/dehydratase family protein [Polyangiales bacterium]